MRSSSVSSLSMSSGSSQSNSAGFARTIWSERFSAACGIARLLEARGHLADDYSGSRRLTHDAGPKESGHSQVQDTRGRAAWRQAMEQPTPFQTLLVPSTRALKLLM